MAKKIAQLVGNRKVPRDLKLTLRREAGERCANPGCNAWRTHLHHMRHWAVYRTHDGQFMIAVCPNCHDEIHHGNLGIDEQTLLRWKLSSGGLGRRHVSVQAQPAASSILQTGPISFQSHVENSIFHLSNGSFLKMKLLEQTYLQVSLRLVGSSGEEIVRVVENNVEFTANEEVICDFRTGRATVTVPAGYVPDWVMEQAIQYMPSFVNGGRVSALDMEVIAPGAVRVLGYWVDERSAVILSQDLLMVCGHGREFPVQLTGEGLGSRLLLDGDFHPSFLSHFIPWL